MADTSSTSRSRLFRHIDELTDKDGGGDTVAKRVKIQESFSWTKDCFICGSPCHENKKREWSFVSNSDESGSNDIYTKVLCAARERKDQTIQTRLLDVKNGDLQAIGARYHRRKNCLTSYIDENKIKISQCIKAVGL